MIKDGFSQDLQSLHTSCAAAQSYALQLLDQQQMKEPIVVTRERELRIENTANQVVNLAEGIDLEFCKQHCDPSNCIARTGETIIQLNKRILTASGTSGKKEVLDQLKESDTIQLTPADPKCPHTTGATELILDDLRRSGNPDSELFGDPAPGLDKALVHVIDLEVLEDPDGKKPSGPPISPPKRHHKRKKKDTNQLNLFDVAS